MEYEGTLHDCIKSRDVEDLCDYNDFIDRIEERGSSIMSIILPSIKFSLVRARNITLRRHDSFDCSRVRRTFSRWPFVF